jgi:hypothetical protein
MHRSVGRKPGTPSRPVPRPGPVPRACVTQGSGNVRGVHPSIQPNLDPASAAVSDAEPTTPAGDTRRPGGHPTRGAGPLAGPVGGKAGIFVGDPVGDPAGDEAGGGDHGLAAGAGCSSGQLEGPWSGAFWTVTETRLRSKSNFRRARRASNSSAWATNVEFEKSLSLTLRSARPAGWPANDNSVPLRERCVFVAVTIARSTIDAGNHSKSVLDAAEGVLYVNDAQVAASCAVAERGLRDPYLMVAFAHLPPGSGMVDVATAASALLEGVSTELLHLGYIDNVIVKS